MFKFKFTFLTLFQMDPSYSWLHSPSFTPTVGFSLLYILRPGIAIEGHTYTVACALGHTITYLCIIAKGAGVAQSSAVITSQ